MKELSGLCRGDAAIVGAGLTSLLLASSLAQAGMRVIVLDTGETRIPPSTCLGTILCVPAYQRIRTVHSPDIARLYTAALTNHLADMLAAPPPYVQAATACLYACTADDLPQLAAQQELLQQLGITASISADTGSCPFPVEALLKAPNQVLMDMAQWRTSLMQNIRRWGGRICTGAPITSLDGSKVCTTRGCVEASMLVFAGGIPPIPQKLPHPYLLERHLLLLRELRSPFPMHSGQLSLDGEGISLSPAPDGAIACWDAGRCGTRLQQERLRSFEAALSARLPDWQQGSTCYLYETFSRDGLPVIGNLPGSRHLFAVGTGGAGILGAMHAAAVLSRRILGQVQPDDRMYAPDRPLPRWFIRQEQHNQQAMRLRNMLRRGAPACSHCSCRMRYCTALSHWECPSCGSVFDLLGQVICGPAMRGAKVSARQRPDW